LELNHEFTVGVPVEQAWAVLTDVERIAPCMPGAELREVEGDEYRGVVKVKVGPISAEYRGKATFLEQDETAHRAVLRAEGREARGQGNANATITAELTPSEGATRVAVTTELTVTGRVAQFGRGVLGEVSNKLLGQFVECLESTVLSAPSTGSVPAENGEAPAASEGASSRDGSRGAGGPASSSGSAETVDPEEAGGSVDLLKVVGPSVAKRVAPILAALAVISGFVWLRRRRARR
jgi:hypothetical protein